MFVFDGGVPELKRKTIQSRRCRNEDLVNRQLDRLKAFVKDKHNVNLDLKGTHLRSTKLQGFRDDNKLFYLDDNLNDLSEASDEFEEVKDTIILNGKQFELEQETNPILDRLKHHPNVTDIDTNSDEFQNLPPELRHEILTEIKEAKKFNVVERQLPEDMGDYSCYQIDKLVKSHDIQKQIEKTRKEMIGQRGLSHDQQTEEYEKYISTRIASDEFTKLVFTKKATTEIKPSIVKSIEKPTKSYNPNIYGTVEEFDYDITEQLDPEAKNGLINDRMKKKLEIKKELDDDSSTDDSDFVAVRDGTIEDDSIDNLEFSLSAIHPLLLLNEKQVVEDQVNEQTKDEQASNKPVQQLKSPYKRPQDLLSSTTEPDKKRTNLLASFVDEKNKVLEDAFNVTINENKTIVLDETVEEKDEEERVQINKSEIVSVCLDNSDELFESETQFEEDLNKFLDKIQSDEESKIDKSATTTKGDELNEEAISKVGTITSPIKQPAKGLSIDFLESEDVELIGLVDKKLIDEITESPIKSRLESPRKSNSSQSNTPKKDLKFVQLKPPTGDQLANNKIKPKPQDLSETLQLVRDIRKVKRQTNTVENSIIEETKELLTLFGIPYVISPMEAEAQCAILEQLNLTKGTITDDGDVWLFGAQTVYKNFYNQSKFVMKYTVKEIEERLKLTRDNLICFAMLTGSDYTDGIKGVGPVTATEIISEFNSERMQPLINFKMFWQDRKDGKPKKFNKTREKFLKYDLPRSFPNQTVFDAYVSPEVDSSTEKFQFGKPDLDLLRRYTNEKFNWSKDKQDAELLPLFKRINDSSTQTKISSFFQVVAKNREPDKFGSKRLQKALEKKSSESDKLNDPKDALKSKNGKSTKTKETKKKTVKKTDAKRSNNGKVQQEAVTLKHKVKNQRKKADTNKVPSIFNKEIKISQYFSKEQPKIVNRTTDDEVICLSEDSD